MTINIKSIPLETLKALFAEAESSMQYGCVASLVGHGKAVYFLRHTSIRQVEAFVINESSLRHIEVGAAPSEHVHLDYYISWSY